MLNPSIQKAIEQTLDTTIYQAQVINGGDINQAFKVQSASGDYFLKLNDIPTAFQMFETEAKGLQLLADTSEVRIPKVIRFGQTTTYAYLLLEYIESVRPDQTAMERFGRALARLHRHSQSSFGLDHSNFIGRLPPSNS